MRLLGYHTVDWKSQSKDTSEDGSMESKGLKDRSIDRDDMASRIRNPA